MPKTAEKDITCYKVLVRVDYEDHTEYRSPIYDYLWGIGKMHSEIGAHKDIRRNPWWSTFRMNVPFLSINGGFFHAYNTDCHARKNGLFFDAPYDQLQNLVKYYPSCKTMTFVIATCTVPKGTIFFSNDEEIVSENLRVDSIEDTKYSMNND